MQANITGSYQYTSILFVVMILSPWILLNKTGRRWIGLRLPSNPGYTFLSILVGVALAVGTFLVFDGLYGHDTRNAYVYISRSYTNVPSVLDESTRRMFFLIYAGISMVFSPLGEEFVYRGLIHNCFKEDVGERRASLVDSGAFATVHLSHFGIVYTQLDGWEFLPVPAMVWMSIIFLTGLMFSWARRRSGSVFGSVFCHAAFNAGMNYTIFYYIL